MQDVDGIPAGIILCAMGVNARLRRGGGHRRRDVVRPCAMVGTRQRAPDGEQHGQQHQQQDTNDSHDFRLARARSGISGPGAHDADGAPVH